MKFILSYSRLLLFAIGLLLGVQIPGFIDQYEKRVDAHYREVSANIAGFKATADLLFGGDLQQLIAYYENSNDNVFERDANSIRIIVDRYTRITAEQAALQNDLLAISLHVLFAADREFLEETLAQYSYTVPLDATAVGWGVSLAIMLMFAIDGFLFSCRRGAGFIRKKRRRAGKIA